MRHSSATAASGMIMYEKGEVAWSDEDLRAALDEFLTVWDTRPIRNNIYGVGTPHGFALWFLLRRLRPTHIVESGVLQGQSTWLLETTVPEAQLISIDPLPDERIIYKSK